MSNGTVQLQLIYGTISQVFLVLGKLVVWLLLIVPYAVVKLLLQVPSGITKLIRSVTRN